MDRKIPQKVLRVNVFLFINKLFIHLLIYETYI